MKDLSECSWKRKDADNVILESDLQYENDKYIIRVYKGFISDGGSLPRISWTILGITPFSLCCVLAFFIHDFLYRSKLVSRKEADSILYEILGVPPSCNTFQRWLIWIHVRMWGWMPWKHNKNTQEARKFGELTRKRILAPMVIK